MAKGKYEYWLTQEGLTLLEGWARDGLTDQQISKNCNINTDTLDTGKKKYPEISEAIKKGKEDVYKRQQPKPNKTAIKDILKDGAELPGVRLVGGKRLDIK